MMQITSNNLVKIRRSVAQLLCIFDFHYGGHWIITFPHFLWKNQICAYFYIIVQNLVKIWRPAAELLHIFEFHYGGRPSSSIWYDVIADHLPWLGFYGPDILIKLHVDRVNILRDITIFYIGLLRPPDFFNQLTVRKKTG